MLEFPFWSPFSGRCTVRAWSMIFLMWGFVLNAVVNHYGLGRNGTIDLSLTGWAVLHSNDVLLLITMEQSQRNQIWYTLKTSCYIGASSLIRNIHEQGMSYVVIHISSWSWRPTCVPYFPLFHHDLATIMDEILWKGLYRSKESAFKVW